MCSSPNDARGCLQRAAEAIITVWALHGVDCTSGSHGDAESTGLFTKTVESHDNIVMGFFAWITCELVGAYDVGAATFCASRQPSDSPDNLGSGA